MVLLCRLGVIGSIVIMIGGCGVAQSGELTWVQANGGELADGRQLRVDRLAQPILAQCVGLRITVRVLDTDSVGAFSWPAGHLFVSRGLMDRMEDDEVCAALAHELGHLLGDGHVRSMAGLKGGKADDNLDCESRADVIGVRLLVGNGIAPAAMTSMLRKVCASPGISSSCQERLFHRMEVLRLILSAPTMAPGAG